MSPHDPSKQNAVDMNRAREATSIDVASVRDFIHGGAALWRRHQKTVQTLENDPLFDKSRRPFLTRKEQYIRGQAMTRRLLELQDIHQWSAEDLSVAFAYLDDGLPIGLHNIAFEPIFRLQASPELSAKYSVLIANKGIHGCYLQTELAHGSNVGRLETTATYLPDTREFDIHSPTLTSTKWWIGALGKTATHGVVQAKLILPGGKDMGPHLFFVQLRDLDTHKVLPGLTIGDIGPKALGGFAATDNGFARFDHVRIPKGNMLSKFAGVTDSGEYVTPPHAKLSYGGMLYIRSGRMVTTAGWAIGRAVTIAVRYATVRRQGEIGRDKLERQVITYPSLNVRLVPIVARAYVFIELGRFLQRGFDSLAKGLSSGDMSQLAEMHMMTSGLKILVTTSSIQDIETARRSMGGHGYSGFSGVGKLYADYLPAATYEGENFVLDGQVIRAALKSFRNITASSTPPKFSPTSAYLRLLVEKDVLPPELSPASWRNVTIPILLLEWRAALLVHEAAQTIGQPDSTLTHRVSRAVTEAFVAGQVGQMIAALGSTALKPHEAEVVSKIYLLYLLTTVESALVDLLSYGLFRAVPSGKSRDPTRELRVAIGALCSETLLPEVIGLTDSFGFSDWELDSALGVFDGRAYEAMWKRAQDEPLNQTEVTEAYAESIKPILLRGQRLASKSKL
ncbi:Acyl-coenzyme A oxidase [Mycena indigotica]|uniref:Acyl-coenzyme A oxidase n=1 Tax=Mycena indigotica TaxID=2126181 RepID=A0A8H6SEF4_9AGAR|nr:Acyl-coenzyme A oxidase [Mycena indigotica]KAF7297428.1 Acyl-coenzyme A oxidase [Mycena indigotica]